MAAEVLLKNAIHVDLFDAMPSVGRKFLMAGKTGLNLTHNENFERFTERYGAQQEILRPHIKRFSPSDIRKWAKNLGIETYVGSSQRVFPVEMKAAPLLRAWLHQLRGLGLKIHVRHYWKGWSDEGELLFDTPRGIHKTKPTATLLALGGGSWPQLGSTADWQSILKEKQIKLTPLAPANCGFNYPWSTFFATQHAGDAVKSIVICHKDKRGHQQEKMGDFIITRYGLEGSLIYAFTHAVRLSIQDAGQALLFIDLTPHKTPKQLYDALSRPRGSHTMAKHLQRHAGIKGVKAKLLRELAPREAYNNTSQLIQYIKQLPISIHSIRPLEEAISSAGGVAFNNFDENMMLTTLPSVFCAGEMLDWEAPTGGYLFSACFATGYSAGMGIVNWLHGKP